MIHRVKRGITGYQTPFEPTEGKYYNIVLLLFTVNIFHRDKHLSSFNNQYYILGSATSTASPTTETTMTMGGGNENDGRVSQATVGSSVPNNGMITDATTSSNTNVATPATSAIPPTTMITTTDTTASNVVNISDGSSTHPTGTPTVPTGTGTTPKTTAEDNHATSLIPENNNSATTTLATDTNAVHSTTTEGANDILSSEGSPIAPTSIIAIANTTTGTNFSSTVGMENSTSIVTVVSPDAATTLTTSIYPHPTPTDGSTNTSISRGEITHVRILATKRNKLDYIFYYMYLDDFNRLIFLTNCRGIWNDFNQENDSSNFDNNGDDDFNDATNDNIIPHHANNKGHDHDNNKNDNISR